MTTTRYLNTTGKGNVAAIEIIVDDTPHSPAGLAHAKLVNIFRSGSRNTATGNYFPTREAADAKASEWAAKLLAAGCVVDG